MLAMGSFFKNAGLIIFSILLSGSYTCAQRFPVRTYTDADGLANSMIFDIKQDSSGLIWIARRSGITSFDGICFKNYNISDGLKASSYGFLKIDPYNKLWAHIDNGNPVVSLFVNNHWENATTTKGFNHPHGFAFTAFDVKYAENKPVFLVGTDKDGLFKYQDGSWRQFQTADGLPSDCINSIIQFEDKTLIATSAGLSVLSGNIFSGNIRDVSPYFKKSILAMAIENEVLWLLGKDWLGSYSNGRFTLATQDFDLPVEHNGRKCFLQADRQGRIYFGNPYKVLSFDKANSRVEFITRSNGLISEGGSSVLVDREYNTWIGGYRGITKIQSRRFASYYHADGLYSNEVASGMEISPGRYVFGHEGALTFNNGSGFKKLKLVASPDSGNYESRILDMSLDDKGTLWMAASAKGLARLERNNTVKWYGEKEGLRGMVFSVLGLPGGKLYVGTSFGLFELSGDRFVKLNYMDMRGSSVRKVFRGEGRSVFLTTMYSGVMELKDGRIIAYRSAENLLANSVFAFLSDSKHRKWVGTATGLYFIGDTSLIKAGSTGPSISRPIYVILEDRSGRLWFGCDNGVYRWDGKLLDHFSTSEGMSGQEINRGAGFIDSKGRIWFGTNNGLTVYNPADDYASGQIPPPLLSISYIESGGDTIFPGSLPEFAYDRNNPTIHFRALSFIDEKQLVYRYKLEGLDTGWSKEIYYENNSVKYNNLRPGVYRFCVKARNSLGLWSEPVCTDEIRIAQPFWFSWWFMIVLIISLGIIGVLTARYILVTRYNARLQRMVLERTAELEHSEQLLRESNQAKDNFFSIIAHDLKSPFNVILGMLDLLTKDYDDYSDDERQSMLMRLKNASTRTIDLLENLLTWARAQRGMIPFNPVRFNLLNIIRENILLFEHASLSKEIIIKQSGLEKAEVTADENMINTIVRNLISNAIKFTLPGGIITIKVEYENQANYLISVKDTGVGMSEATVSRLFKIEDRMVIRGTNNEMGTGLGLILSKDFVEKNKGRIWVSSEEGVGSTFYFTLPAN